ncbi:MAG: FtsK/SpoIIIE domain-containing protein, partial [Candidatus Dormibacteraceae bacterium]
KIRPKEPIPGISWEIPSRWLAPGGVLLGTIWVALAWALGLSRFLLYPLLAAALVSLLVALFKSRGQGGGRGELDPAEVVASWSQFTALGSPIAKALVGSKASIWKRDEVGWSLLLELSSGHTVSEVIAITPNLESALKVRKGSLRIIPDELAHRCFLRAVTKDLLSSTEKWPGPSSQSILEPLRLGTFEDGAPALLSLVPEASKGVSLLLAGQTGMGKSSLINIIVGSLANYRDVVLMGIDPQRTELGPWQAAFEPDCLVLEAGAKAERLLERLVAIMSVRTKLLASQGRRSWVPSANQPEIVLVVDEAADLVSMMELLFLLARKGRKVGIHLILATQRSSAKSLGEWGTELSAQFGVKICLGVNSITDVNIVLGPGAAGEGWRADQMLARPGEFLIRSRHSEHSSPRRARGYLVSDCEVEKWAASLSGRRPRLDEISAAAGERVEVMV